jgi:hypothetical protein
VSSAPERRHFPEKFGAFYADGHNSTLTPAFSNKRTNSSRFFLIGASSMWPPARIPASCTATTKPYGHALDGNFSKYATTSAGAIVRIFVAGLSETASIPFACTIKYGFFQFWPSLIERYLAGLAGAMRFFRADFPVTAAFCALVACGYETKAIAAPNRQAAIRNMQSILAWNSSNSRGEYLLFWVHRSKM